MIKLRAVHKVGPILTPLSLSHIVTHLGTPPLSGWFRGLRTIVQRHRQILCYCTMSLSECIGNNKDCLLYYSEANKKRILRWDGLGGSWRRGRRRVKSSQPYHRISPDRRRHFSRLTKLISTSCCSSSSSSTGCWGRDRFLLWCGVCCVVMLMMPLRRGVHPPLRPWCISPLFQICPLFLKNFRTFWIFFTILPFPEKFLDFHPPKFLMTLFLVIGHKSRISPLFSLIQYISPLFREHFSFPPTFPNFPLF